MKQFLSQFSLAALLCTNIYSFELDMSVGVHDFIVSDIKTQGLPVHIEDGTSHTLGVNLGIWAFHTTQSGINLKAKAEAFLDRDKDELDKDHIPIWFDFLIDIDGPLYSFNPNNSLLWYIYLDNKQNTVSCIEREIRQHIGIGYKYTHNNFFSAVNAYAGFYYIEIDDDTPGERGYERFDLDNGEASNVFEVELGYNFNDSWQIYANAKRYSTNAGFSELETDINFLLSYNNASFIKKDASLHLNVKYAKYNFDDFNANHPLPILPWDNDTLVQVYTLIPF